MNTTTTGDQTVPQVAVLTDGSFEVVWVSGGYIKARSSLTAMTATERSMALLPLVLNLTSTAVRVHRAGPSGHHAAERRRLYGGLAGSCR